MNIDKIIKYINEKYDGDLSSKYYNNIDNWEKWWQGFYQPFHEFKEVLDDGTVKPRKLYTMKMGKKVCEDWASLLLNEKTEIVIGDSASSQFLIGDKEKEKEEIGLLERIGFWDNANTLIEKAFYSGTGALIVRLNNMTIVNDKLKQDNNTEIDLEYLSASQIIPISYRHGKVVDVAFASEILEKGKKYIYIETHILEGDEYVITNQYLSDTKYGLKEEELPTGIIETIRTGSNQPWFALISPNIVNNIKENNGLGLSIFANAIDNLMGVDLGFNNFCKDFKLGGKKVFMNEKLTKTDSKGNIIAPDDVAQQLFTGFGDDFIDKNGNNNLIHEFNPTLRVTENKEGIQAHLDYLSFKCGLGTKHYQFNAGSIVTATQYTGDKQELVQNANKHYIPITNAIQTIIRAILWCAKEIVGVNVNPDAQIILNFDDSFVIDSETERARDLSEVDRSIMQPWEYREKWYGETKDEAIAALENTEEPLSFEPKKEE